MSGPACRMGKVRKQTPKVEKLIKHKKKTGRARQRQKYAKRILNKPNEGAADAEILALVGL